jgi:hypothetical protein
MLCCIVTACYDCVTQCYIAGDSIFCCWLFLPYCSQTWHAVAAVCPTNNSDSLHDMLCWIVTVWFNSATHCYIIRDSMFCCCWIVPPYCSNTWHTVATVRHNGNAGSSHNMLCWVVTVWYNSATHYYIVSDNDSCRWCIEYIQKASSTCSSTYRKHREHAWFMQMEQQAHTESIEHIQKAWITYRKHRANAVGIVYIQKASSTCKIHADWASSTYRKRRVHTASIEHIQKHRAHTESMEYIQWASPLQESKVTGRSCLARSLASLASFLTVCKMPFCRSITFSLSASKAGSRAS